MALSNSGCTAHVDAEFRLWGLPGEIAGSPTCGKPRGCGRLSRTFQLNPSELTDTFKETRWPSFFRAAVVWSFDAVLDGGV